jgi:hypothetical protein
MTTFEVVGMYRITPTVESITAAVQYHGDEFLLDELGNYVDEIPWEDLTDLGLAEVEIQRPFSLEDASGTRLLPEKEAMEEVGRRLCFFLHFVDASKPLRVGDASLELPEMSELPTRLVPFTHYEPVG